MKLRHILCRGPARIADTLARIRIDLITDLERLEVVEPDVIDCLLSLIQGRCHVQVCKRHIVYPKRAGPVLEALIEARPENKLLPDTGTDLGWINSIILVGIVVGEVTVVRVVRKGAQLLQVLGIYRRVCATDSDN